MYDHPLKAEVLVVGGAGGGAKKFNPKQSSGLATTFLGRSGAVGHVHVLWRVEPLSGGLSYILVTLYKTIGTTHSYWSLSAMF